MLNPQTAYFVVPEDMDHGEELNCSYLPCRNTGIKFRYCKQCRIPVAKRNFRNRHRHGFGDVKPLGDEDEEASTSASVATTVAKEEERTAAVSALIAHPKLTADVDESNVVVMEAKRVTPESASHADRNKERQEEAGQGIGHSAVGIERVPSAQNSARVADESGDREGDGKKVVSEERKRRWAALLSARPRMGNSKGMSEWLLNVLAISDLAKPLGGLGEGLVVEQQRQGMHTDECGRPAKRAKSS